MAFPIFYPYVNGLRYDYSAITFLASGQPIVGIIAIDYEAALEESMVYGTLAQPIGRTRGQLKSTFSFEMLQLEFENFISQLCLLNNTPGSGYMEAVWTAGVQYQDGTGVNQGPLISDLLVGCRLKKTTYSRKAGPDALATKCECSLYYILKNGQAPIGITDGLAPKFIYG